MLAGHPVATRNDSLSLVGGEGERVWARGRRQICEALMRPSQAVALKEDRCGCEEDSGCECQLWLHRLPLCNEKRKNVLLLIRIFPPLWTCNKSTFQELGYKQRSIAGFTLFFCWLSMFVAASVEQRKKRNQEENWEKVKVSGKDLHFSVLTDKLCVAVIKSPPTTTRDS